MTYDIAGAQLASTDVLVIGGGGAGCAAALAAEAAGAKVILATKLRLGDSNTVMAEGGIQAAVGDDDSPQRHFEDSIKAGHDAADRHLVAQMVLDGPDVVRWLIQLGVAFDMADEKTLGGTLAAQAGRRRFGRAHPVIPRFHRPGDDARAAGGRLPQTRHRDLEPLPGRRAPVR